MLIKNPRDKRERGTSPFYLFTYQIRIFIYSLNEYSSWLLRSTPVFYAADRYEH